MRVRSRRGRNDAEPSGEVVPTMRLSEAPARPKHDSRDWSRGQSVVELALIAPVLLLMLLITLDFGRLFLSYVTLNNVTRVAANFGALSPDSFTGTPDTTTYDAVVDRESQGLNCDLQGAGGYNPPLPQYPDGTQLGGTSVATMTCDFSLLTPLISSFFGAKLPITAQAEFPIRTGAIANIGGSTNLPPPGSPVADFSFSGVTSGSVDGSGNVTGTAPLSLNVTDSSSNAQTWKWSWGDGTADDFTQNPATHTYAVANTYTVTLTVSNTIGTSQRTHTVTLTPAATPPPVAGFYGTPVGSPPQAQGGGSDGTAIRGSAPLTVDFTNQSTGANAYSWDFGDGGTSTQGDPQHQFADLGEFTVGLTITDPAGGSAYIRQNYVTIGCVVPNFANAMTDTANSTWTAAGFTGTLTFQPVGANGGSQKSTTPPSTPKLIQSQEGLTGGDLVDPVQQNKNSPWLCSQAINLRYVP